MTSHYLYYSSWHKLRGEAATPVLTHRVCTLGACKHTHTNLPEWAPPALRILAGNVVGSSFSTNFKQGYWTTANVKQAFLQLPEELHAVVATGITSACIRACNRKTQTSVGWNLADSSPLIAFEPMLTYEPSSQQATNPR